MNKLDDEIKELENLYKLNKSKLIGVKLFTLFGGILALLYAYDYLNQSKHKFHLTEWEITEAKAIVGLLLMTYLLFIPLYKYFSDRVTNKINWDIKMSIFENTLNKYKCEYKVQFKGVLPDEDLKFLRFENGISKFADGDDLIFGTLNQLDFHIAETHSINLLGKSFHGLVGVLIFPEISLTSTQKSEILQSGNNFTKLINRNKFYLTKRASTNMFEFSIKHDKINKSKLHDDLRFFDEFVRELNTVCQLHSITTD